MYLRTILASLSILLASAAYAQNVTFQLSGGVNHLMDQDYSDVQQTIFTSFRPWYMEDDTFNIIQKVNGERSYNTFSTGKLGYDVTMDMLFPLNSRLFLSTGIGFNYSAYSYTDDYDIQLLDTLSSDTVPYSGSSLPGGVIQMLCDCYENSYLDVRDQIRTPTVQALSMVIPVKVNYGIIPHRLSMYAGAYGQIPLWIAQKESVISIEQNEVAGMTKCKYVITDHADLSGDGVRRLQVGISAGIEIDIFKGIGLNLGVSKMLTNIYVAHEYQSSIGAKDYRPFQVYARVAYTFRNKVSMAN